MYASQGLGPGDQALNDICEEFQGVNDFEGLSTPVSLYPSLQTNCLHSMQPQCTDPAIAQFPVPPPSVPCWPAGNPLYGNVKDTLCLSLMPRGGWNINLLTCALRKQSMCDMNAHSASVIGECFSLPSYWLEVSAACRYIPLHNHHGVGDHYITPLVTDWSVVML